MSRIEVCDDPVLHEGPCFGCPEFGYVVRHALFFSPDALLLLSRFIPELASKVLDIDGQRCELGRHPVITASEIRIGKGKAPGELLAGFQGL